MCLIVCTADCTCSDFEGPILLLPFGLGNGDTQLPTNATDGHSGPLGAGTAISFYGTNEEAIFVCKQN